MAEDRSFTDVVQSIIGNVQEIVRSEVRLAKAELGEQATKAKSSASLLGAGAIISLYAGLFVLLAIVYGLALVIPNWAAALLVGVVLAGVGIGMLNSGMRRFKQLHPTPERTVETIKENVEWAKQQTK